MSRIGHTLGQYRIIEPIGKGGMATVWQSKRTDCDRTHLSGGTRQSFSTAAEGFLTRTRYVLYHDLGVLVAQTGPELDEGMRWVRYHKLRIISSGHLKLQ